MPGAILSVCRETGQRGPESPGEFVRCILESLALKYRCVLDQLRQVHDNPINRIHVIGGGVRNKILCQFTANATRLPVIAGPAEATAVGNIMVQALSRGYVASLAEMREVIGRSFDCTTYELQQASEWDAAYKRFRDITDVVTQTG
jgi:sugar (pentulose or hexulose) kinase